LYPFKEESTKIKICGIERRKREKQINRQSKIEGREKQIDRQKKNRERETDSEKEKER
jgi:hypothetical protein